MHQSLGSVTGGLPLMVARDHRHRCVRGGLSEPAGLAYLHRKAEWSHHPQAAKAHWPNRLTSA